MARRTSEKEMAAVLKLDGPARVRHFVKRVVDAEAAWALWQDGWLLMNTNEGEDVFPLWPAREYAEAYRDGQWKNAQARSIALSELQDDLLPGFVSRGVLPGVFPTPRGQGVVISSRELAALLKEELEKYS